MTPAASPVVVLPTYNERENIVRLVPEILKQDARLRVLVVDDRSPDKTYERVGELAKQVPGRVKLLLRDERGRGTAVLRGFQEAIDDGATCVFEMDADFSHNPADLPRFLHAIETNEVVIGSRFVPGGQIENRGWFRNGLSWLINALIRLILGIRVRDASGGYRCYRAEVLKKLDFAKFVSHGYSMGAEILYLLKKLSIPVVEIPIIFENRKAGKSKANFAVALNFIFSLLKIRFKP